MGQYFSNEKLNSDISRFETNILDYKFSFFTDNGVFSKKKLDFGSRVLLENLPAFSSNNSILDVGCGYGPIGIFISKRDNCIVDMVDVNKRAIHLTKMNAKKNNVNINTFESNVYSNISRKYDIIISNPPIRAGKKIVYEIIMNANNYLNDEGTLFIVVNKDQGAKTIISDLKGVYDVDVIAKNKGFFVIKCKKIVDLLQHACI